MGRWGWRRGGARGGAQAQRARLSRPEERRQTQKRRGCAKVQTGGRGREGMNEPLEGVQHGAGQRAPLRKEVAC